MKKIKKTYIFEILIYAFISIIVLAIPIFIYWNSGEGWSFILREWKHIIPFFLIFLINNFILAPKLLLKSKYSAYIISCIVVLVLMSFLNHLLFSPKMPLHKNVSQNKEIKLYDKEPMPGMRPDFCDPGEQPGHLGNKINPGNYDSGDKLSPPRFPKEKPKPFYFRFFDFGMFIIGLLIMGFNSGIKIFVRWTNEQEEYSEKERQYLSTELAFLRHQISPHFFMNTLNNIHALIDIDPEKAKDTIIKLSRMMRYLLYESETEKNPLSKEVGFLESYVELIRLRYDESSLSVNIKYPQNTDNIYVPSLLFLPFIENAFKHGVLPGKKSFVSIEFSIRGDNLILTVINSNFARQYSEFDKGASGIGLENIKKRLSLIYKENYEIVIKSDDNIFDVLLIIPVK